MYRYLIMTHLRNSISVDRTLNQILCTSKLTEEYWTLIYINRSFSLMQLLMMFQGPLSIGTRCI